MQATWTRTLILTGASLQISQRKLAGSVVESQFTISNLLSRPFQPAAPSQAPWWSAVLCSMCWQASGTWRTRRQRSTRGPPSAPDRGFRLRTDERGRQPHSARFQTAPFDSRRSGDRGGSLARVLRRKRRGFVAGAGWRGGSEANRRLRGSDSIDLHRQARAAFSIRSSPMTGPKRRSTIS